MDYCWWILTIHVQKIIFRQNDHPLIILYFPQQIDQLIHFCSRNPLNGPLSTLGIDTTFNVSAYYATVSVFKNTAVFRRSDSRYNSPVMLGPILLSSDREEKLFENFYQKFAMQFLMLERTLPFPHVRYSMWDQTRIKHSLMLFKPFSLIPPNFFVFNIYVTILNVFCAINWVCPFLKGGKYPILHFLICEKITQAIPSTLETEHSFYLFG